MMDKMFPKNYLVNITTDKKNKHAVVHIDNGTIDFDEKRGDKRFASETEATEYADSINNSK
jgi:hypothetical protein